ncbi:hypothetical protein [Acinetobacter baumannii]|uniref:hypothetical protein n=1 Tax=Acinetobacter baumannii TaxID=470 RepID=UPI0023425161|nr:hypothetical protein [Acinetobacter baumannii]MDC4548845.1 hypothetical protein [Acinetobacter baumannii]
MIDLNKKREAFERFHAKECNCRYESLKRHLDRQEALTGHRYLPTSPRHEAWLIWDAAWNEASAQVLPDQIINEIQSWIAVQSTQAMELDGEAFVVGANELAGFIEQLVKKRNGS